MGFRNAGAVLNIDGAKVYVSRKVEIRGCSRENSETDPLKPSAPYMLDIGFEFLRFGCPECFGHSVSW